MSSSSNFSGDIDTRMRVILAIVVVAIIAVITVVVVKVGTGTSSSANTEASADIMKKVSTVPDSVFASVGAGTVKTLPSVIANPQAFTKDNKPSILYVGGEFCPYCATQRWPVVVALSRFGTFSGLKITHSASADVYPNTQSFSFHGSSYTSQYVDFQGVETMDNVQHGTSYGTLDTLTADQQNIVNTYDAAPYVPSQSAGSVPFIYYGKYLSNGSSYDPSILQGKSADDIAAALANPDDAISKGVIGTANSLTATICILTNDQPGNVCTLPVIQSLETQIKAQTATVNK